MSYHNKNKRKAERTRIKTEWEKVVEARRILKECGLPPDFNGTIILNKELRITTNGELPPDIE